MFKYAVEEVDERISENIHPTWSILDPTNPRTTIFGVINDTGKAINSDLMSCHINEGLTANASFGNNDFMFGNHAAKRVDPGGDDTLTRCLYSIRPLPESSITCADVTLIVNYTVLEFPRRKKLIKYRFFLNKRDSDYEWIRIGVWDKFGRCTGSPIVPG